MLKLNKKDFWSTLKYNSNLYNPFVIELENFVDFGINKEFKSGWINLFLNERTFKLYVEIALRTAPSIVKTTLYSLKERREADWDKNFIYALLVPYLTKEIVEYLKKEGLSGLDPNSNYFIIKNDLVAIRLDKKKFPGK